LSRNTSAVKKPKLFERPELEAVFSRVEGTAGMNAHITFGEHSNN
jgi:hypothetical protein